MSISVEVDDENIGLLSDRLSDQLGDWLSDQLGDWLSDQLGNKVGLVSRFGNPPRQGGGLLHYEEISLN